MDSIEQLKLKCAELERALTEDTPGYKTVLREIHENIRKTPEMLYALADEEIAVVVSGLSKLSDTEILETKKKEAKTISKKLAAKLSADDV